MFLSCSAFGYSSLCSNMMRHPGQVSRTLRPLSHKSHQPVKASPHTCLSDAPLLFHGTKSTVLQSRITPDHTALPPYGVLCHSNHCTLVMCYMAPFLQLHWKLNEGWNHVSLILVSSRPSTGRLRQECVCNSCLLSDHKACSYQTPPHHQKGWPSEQQEINSLAQGSR